MKQNHRNSDLRLTAMLIVALFVAGPTHSVRAQSFEGVVEFSITTERGTMPMSYMVKGDNVRIEMEGRPGMKAAVLIDAKEGKSIMLMDQMKMYMDVPKPPAGDSSQAKPEISKTGKTQKILDYTCEQYLIKDGEMQSEVWITKELGAFQMFHMASRDRNAKAEAWQKIIGSEGGFPLSATTKNGDEQISKMVATKVEKKSLDEALFKIPEGYKQFDPSMMGRPRQ